MFKFLPTALARHENYLSSETAYYSWGLI